MPICLQYPTVLYEVTESGKKELSSARSKEVMCGKGDFLLEIRRPDESFFVSAAERKGRRKQQEDRISIEFLPTFSLLTTPEKNKVLEDTIKQIQSEVGKLPEGVQGSSLMSVIREKKRGVEHFWVTHLGNSLAFLVILKADEGTMVTRLNNQLHQLRNPQEVVRVQQSAKEVTTKLLKTETAKLSVTRAIGDVDFDHLGVSHEPEIIQKTYVPCEGESAYLIVCSDGLLEKNTHTREPALTNEMIASIVRLNHKSTPDLPELLVLRAILNGSKDNCSCVVFPLSGGETIALNIFDGHRGVAIADFLQNQYGQVLLNKCQETLQQRSSETLTDEAVVQTQLIQEIERTLAAHFSPPLILIDSKLKASQLRKLMQQIKDSDPQDVNFEYLIKEWKEERVGFPTVSTSTLFCPGHHRFFSSFTIRDNIIDRLTNIIHAFDPPQNRVSYTQLTRH